MEHQSKKRSREHDNEDRNSALQSNYPETITQPPHNNNSNRYAHSLLNIQT